MPKRSLQWEVPEETARVARLVFPKGNEYLRLRDKLGIIYEDSDFAELFSRLGRPEESPGLMALVQVLQYAEGLSDRQAAAAVGSRIDWKYLLGLELSEPGFDHTLLGDFRERLLAGGRERQLLESLLSRFQEQGLLKAGGRQRTDATHVLAASRQLNRLENVGETMRLALEVLATVAPQWLQSHLKPEWFERYQGRFENYRLPKGKSERAALQHQIGQDGAYLLAQIYLPEAPSWLRQVPAVEIMRQIWLQQYYLDEQGQLHCREADNLPPYELLIQSPYEVQARNRTKRELNWTGYSVHLTETCDPDRLHVITHVETTPATTHEINLTEVVHQGLAAKGLLPAEHCVDTAYVDGEQLVKSQQTYQLELIGPVAADTSWQAQANQGFDLPQFQIDWVKQQATCPAGRLSQRWSPGYSSKGQPTIRVQFSRRDCLVCTCRENCTKAVARQLCLRPQAEHEALQLARLRQQQQDFKQRYKARAGIEGTLSQATRAFGLRRARYIGLAKTHLQHVITAVAINLCRLAACLAGVPFASTRHSKFATLAVPT